VHVRTIDDFVWHGDGKGSAQMIRLRARRCDRLHICQSLAERLHIVRFVSRRIGIRDVLGQHGLPVAGPGKAMLSQIEQADMLRVHARDCAPVD
jgi:hypothetical protein